MRNMQYGICGEITNRNNNMNFIKVCPVAPANKKGEIIVRLNKKITQIMFVWLRLI